MSLVVTRRVTPVGKRTLEPEVGRVPPCQLLGLLHNPLELPSQTAPLADTAASKIATAGSTGRNCPIIVRGVECIEGFYIGFPQNAVLKFREIARGFDGVRFFAPARTKLLPTDFATMKLRSRESQSLHPR